MKIKEHKRQAREQVLRQLNERSCKKTVFLLFVFFKVESRNVLQIRFIVFVKKNKLLITKPNVLVFSLHSYASLSSVVSHKILINALSCGVAS